VRTRSRTSAPEVASTGGVRGLGPAPPGRHRAGLPAPGRLVLPDAPRLAGRTGAGRLGHHHRRQARVYRPGAGTGESFDAWADFLADLRDSGLASPLLIISDGAGGLIGAIEQTYPKALRQRFLVHRARNILAKVPAGMQAEVKDAYWKIFGTEDLTTRPGPKLVAIIDNPDHRDGRQVPAAYPRRSRR
jgi:hypothetical protein